MKTAFHAARWYFGRLFLLAYLASLFRLVAVATGQPSDLREEFKSVRWSPLTNGVRFGLLLRPVHPEGAKFSDCELELTFYGSTETNGTILWLPPLPQRYALALFDGNSEPVKRTWRGKSLGTAMEQVSSPGAHGYRTTRSFAEDIGTIPPILRLSEYFKIDKAGTFTLKGEIHSLVMVGGKLAPTTFDLPPVQVTIEQQ